MSFFIWPSLFSSNNKANLNCCVGVKEKRPKKYYRDQNTEAAARRCSVKKVFLVFCDISKNTFFHKAPLVAASKHRDSEAEKL